MSAKTLESVDIREFARNLSAKIIKHLKLRATSEIKMEINEDIEDIIHDALEILKED